MNGSALVAGVSLAYPREDVRSNCVSLDDYKVLLYRNEPEGWVAEIPAIEGCYALMSTREEALTELGQVFEMIGAEYREKGVSLPADTTEIVHA
jgi:predicted RNase H-like HicB family nuclease